MQDRDQVIDRAIRLLREPVEIGDDLDRRVMVEVARGPAPHRPGPMEQAGRWLLRPRPVRVSPLAALAAAAAVVLAVIRPWEHTGVATGERATPTAALTATGLVPTRFMLVAPEASQVTLVGDFNDWSTDSTPMSHEVAGGLWTVTVPIPPGRYRYAFFVDGEAWVPDPGAPRALDDDFGRPNSVLTIGGT